MGIGTETWELAQEFRDWQRNVGFETGTRGLAEKRGDLHKHEEICAGTRGSTHDGLHPAVDEVELWIIKMMK